MNVLIFGASGMVGQGVMLEAIASADVRKVFVVGRHSLSNNSDKLNQVLCNDFKNISPCIDSLPRIDACFFCLGQSSSGMTEQEYRAITFDLTLSVAKFLAKKNPDMKFIYVSGAGTDSSARGKNMWARVKGETENALLKCGFSSVYFFRPAIIQPLNGIRSKTSSYRIFYQLLTPLFPLLKLCFPRKILTTSDIGKAMLNAVKQGYPTPVLEVGDIINLARR